MELVKNNDDILIPDIIKEGIDSALKFFYESMVFGVNHHYRFANFHVLAIQETQARLKLYIKNEDIADYAFQQLKNVLEELQHRDFIYDYKTLEPHFKIVYIKPLPISVYDLNFIDYYTIDLTHHVENNIA